MHRPMNNVKSKQRVADHGEVFTPAWLVETMWATDHDGTSIWADPNVKFLAPFTKAGVFPCEITSQLTDKMRDVQARVDHILTKQVFAIGKEK